MFLEHAFEEAKTALHKAQLPSAKSDEYRALPFSPLKGKKMYQPVDPRNIFYKHQI
jgi:hypothetical protein